MSSGKVASGACGACACSSFTCAEHNCLANYLQLSKEQIWSMIEHQTTQYTRKRRHGKYVVLHAYC
jgi:Na+-translocating ferredoxin:NAD+ oxidoreductase RnfC subunit